MRWIQRYRLATSRARRFVRLSMVLALVLAACARSTATGWVIRVRADGARRCHAAASMLSLLVFMLSSLLIAVQVASTQLTPRVIAATFLRDRPVRFTIGLVVFTFMLSVGVLGRSEGSVLQLSTTVCIFASLTSIALFLFLVDYALKALRPVSVVGRVAAEGFEVVAAVYPHLLGAEIDRGRSTLASEPGPVARTIHHAGESATLIAADLRWLSEVGVAARGLIELVPRVGEFVAVGEPLFHLYGGVAGVDDRSLRSALAFGQERTLEQDPMFAFDPRRYRGQVSRHNDPTGRCLLTRSTSLLRRSESATRHQARSTSGSPASPTRPTGRTTISRLRDPHAAEAASGGAPPRDAGEPDHEPA
jgi:uncharacterized membrane protein